MYKYKTVKELAELGIFGYDIPTLGTYLKRTEFTEFRKEVGLKKVVYLHCPKFVKTWMKFKENLQAGRKLRREFSMYGKTTLRKK